MKQDWSEYRITLLLYLGVLILPFSFYFNYSSIQEMTSNTTVLRQLSQSGGEMLAYRQTKELKKRSEIELKVDQNLKNLTPWFGSENRQEFYVGGRSLREDYAQLLKCWERLKSNPQDKTALDCWKIVKSLSFTVDKMLSLKQNKIENFFYINMLVAMTFLILMIMMVRNYIYKQILKSSIYDLSTKLFNKKYFMSQLQANCARSTRHNYPLSILSIAIDGLDKKLEGYDKKTKTHVLEMIGGLIISHTRTSDTAARYDDNHFLVLLPDTEEDNASTLEKRIHEALAGHDFMVDPKPKFKFSTTRFKVGETPESCIARADRLLHD